MSGRDEVWISDPDGKAPKKITNLDNEKGAIVWTPDSTALLYTAADKRLYRYTVGDDKTLTLSIERRQSDRSVCGVARQQVGGVRQAGPHAAVARLHHADRRRRGAARLRRSRCYYSEANAVWTADGRYLVFTVVRGIQQRHRDAGRHQDDDDAVGVAAARSGARSDGSRHRQRGRSARGRSGGAAGRRRDAAAARRRSAGGADRLEQHRASRAAAERAGHDARSIDAGA